MLQRVGAGVWRVRSRLIRGLMCVCVAVTAFGPLEGGVAEAQASPPGSNESIAEKLHGQALEAARSGKYREAAELWLEAERLHPTWKYAYNLARVLHADKRAPEAWAAIQRAQQRGVPDQYRDRLLELRARVRGAMLADHAWLELSVDPKTATVTRDGKPWPAEQWSGWTRDESSRLTISAPGYATETVEWEHAPGASHRKSIRLRKLVRSAVLEVVGGPRGATVRVDDRAVGTMPLTEPIRDLEPGVRLVRVTHPGYHSHEARVDLQSGETRRLEVVLSELAGTSVPDEGAVGGPGEGDPTVKEAASRHSWMWTTGWVAAGVGVAAAATGAGLLVSDAQRAEAVGAAHDGPEQPAGGARGAHGGQAA